MAYYKNLEDKVCDNSSESGLYSLEKHNYENKHSPKIDTRPIKPSTRMTNREEDFDYNELDDNPMLKDDIAEADKYLDYDFDAVNQHHQCKHLMILCDCVICDCVIV